MGARMRRLWSAMRRMLGTQDDVQPIVESWEDGKVTLRFPNGALRSVSEELAAELLGARLFRDEF